MWHVCCPGRRPTRDHYTASLCDGLDSVNAGLRPIEQRSLAAAARSSGRRSRGARHRRHPEVVPDGAGGVLVRLVLEQQRKLAADDVGVV